MDNDNAPDREAPTKDSNKDVSKDRSANIPNNDVTVCLRELRDGDGSAMERLIPHVYDKLHNLASALFRNRGNDTLSPTVLVHEAYVRLCKSDNPEWNDRKHFYRAAALAMRHLLTDYVRARKSDKRGGDAQRMALDENMPISAKGEGVQLVALDAALEKLERLSERQARIVELRFLAGLSIAETADVLNVSERTISLDWNMARAFLQREISADT